MKISDMINALIAREGGYINHKSDHGGPTKYGITAATLSAWRGNKCNWSDVKELSKQEAFEIYEENYYQLPKINCLPTALQPVMLDMAVNMGPRKAIELLQRVCHKMGTPLTIDGIIGPKTVQSAKTAVHVAGQEVVNNLCYARLEYYQGIVAMAPDQAVFLKGWQARARSFLA